MYLSKLPLFAISVALLLSLSGCATIMTGGSNRPVRVQSEPAGASVYLNDAFQGKTPLTLSVARRDRHRLRIERDGFASYSREITPAFNPAVFGNILIGGLIGTGVDIVSGAIVTPNPGTVRLYLLPPEGDYDDKAQVEAARDAAGDSLRKKKKVSKRTSAGPSR